MITYRVSSDDMDGPQTLMMLRRWQWCNHCAIAITKSVYHCQYARIRPAASACRNAGFNVVLVDYTHTLYTSA